MRTPFGRGVLVLSVAAPLAGADVVTVVSSKDNTLYEHPSEDLSNGSGRRMFVGRTDQSPGEDRRRALVEFDVGTLVPPGSIVNSVTLQLHMDKTQVGEHTVSVHRVEQEWGEAGSKASGGEGDGDAAQDGDATWLFAIYPTTTWFQPGGDFDLTPSATTPVDAEGFYTWSTTQLGLDVQAWVDDGATNHGWVLLGDEAADRSAKRFNTREENNVDARPMLTIDFTAPGDTGACCQAGGACSVTTAAGCTILGGVYQGNGTNCSPNPCGAIGACCLAAGACVETTEGDCVALQGEYQGDGTTCTPGLCPVVLEPFVDELPLPAVAQPVSGQVGGVAQYDLAMRQIRQRLHTDLPETTLWGYDGLYPGPTIEAGRDLPVTVRWINDLRDAQGDLRTSHFLPVDTCLHGPDMFGDSPRTVVHLHGGHVPPEADGYPEDAFLPGEEQTYVYPNNQLPATLWYHDHALGITRLNVMMGLAGFYLLRDPFEQSLGLPSGEWEIPLVIQDRTFRSDGSFVYPVDWEDQFFGDTILVNGKVWPQLIVRKGKYRFRIVNGSNSRTYTLSLSNGDPFLQIGGDGGLFWTPRAATEITLSPAERADVIVDFEALPTNTEVVLTNSAPAPFPGNPGVGVVPDVMKFIVKGGQAFTDPVPPTLRPFEELLESASVRERQFLLRKEQGDPCTGFRWLINDLGWNDITEFPVLDTLEVWSFVNPTSMVHPMHVHLVLFQVLDRQDFVLAGDDVVPVGERMPPAPTEAGWKDTVRASPDQITRVIARFDDYAGLYAYHCHILEHEDHEMMRQFLALESPGTPFCYGESCPCGNDNPQGGCRNATGAGAVLYSTGSASVAADDLVLTGVNLPPGALVVPQMAAGQVPPTPFGDGLRCLAGKRWRFDVRLASTAGDATLGPGIAALSLQFPAGGHIAAGSTWSFQWMYVDRNAGGLCGPTTPPGIVAVPVARNTTNAIAVTFVP